MATLIIRRDGKPAQEFVIEKGLTLIGQKADADIKIEDPEGLEERASILQIGDELVLNDLSPSGGTLINGQEAKKRVLKDRDLIVIGEYRMTVQDKRESDKPLGVEEEIALTRPPLTGAGRQGNAADPFSSHPGKKSNLLVILLLATIVLGIGFASYQSYAERKAADALAAKINKAYEEKKQDEAARIQNNARAIESSIKQ